MDEDVSEVSFADWNVDTCEIISAREGMSLLTDDVAHYMLITEASYWDIEAYPNELLSLYGLGFVCSLCHFLKIDALFLLKKFVEHEPHDPKEITDPRSYIQQARLRMNLSQDQVSDVIGYSRAAISLIESSLEGVLIGTDVIALIELCRCLDISFSSIVIWAKKHIEGLNPEDNIRWTRDYLESALIPHTSPPTAPTHEDE